MPSKTQLGRRTWPYGGDNRRHTVRGRESNFSAVRRANSTSQQPIATSQPNRITDTHTHGRKKPSKERLGCGEGFPQRHQQENPRRARFGVLRIAVARKVQLPEGPSSRTHHQYQDEALPAQREKNCGIEGALQQRVGI